MSTPKPISPQQNKLLATRALMLAAIFGVVAIIALGMSAMAWYKVGRLSGGIEAQVTQLERIIDKNKTVASTHLSSLKSDIQDQQKRLLTAQNKLDTFLDNTSGSQTRRLLGQAAYLLHLANLHLTVGHDSDSAIKLLTLAKQKIDQAPGTFFLPLKQTLGKDINALKKAPKINVTQLILSLNDLDDAIQNIRIAPKGPIPTASTPNTNTTPAKTWEDKVTNFLGSFKDLIRIRHINEPVTPLLLPSESSFLKQNIQIKINQAEWAILKGNNALYQKNLQTIKTCLQRFYGDRPDIKTLYTKLDQLLAVDITPTLPKIDDSLKVLDRLSTGAQS